MAEPAKCWHDALKTNRACHIDTRCVWNKSNEVIEFCESSSPALSTIQEFVDDPVHRETRKVEINTYSVNTITLLDLLEHYNAPQYIDFLSIDTEGSELTILESFDFSKYDIRIIIIEHNFSQNRERIYSLLTRNGYERRHFELTGCDDWYVRKVNFEFVQNSLSN